MKKRFTPREKRIPVRLEVDRTTVDVFYQSEIMNISQGGIFLRADIVLPVGSPIDLEFMLPKSKKKIAIKGTVVWARSARSGSKDSFPDHVSGMGIQFDTISIPDIDLLLEEIDQLST